ncbi:phosphoribosylanthranilate isomerase [Methanobacterium aggregans]|uniref:phosphoribosylanthranilate isomerase n=1 Tax=Methanobacterium aggregans TaxID=1615586 RepID=UPI00320C946D
MKVKICGMTRPEDVQICEDAGADFIGFINIKRSKRFVELERINELKHFMKNKDRAVLVMEPENAEEVLFALRKTGIKILQLHSLSPYEIKYLKWRDCFKISPLEKDLKIVRAVGISDKLSEDKKEEIKEFARVCDAIIFDYEVEGKSGGTGRQIPIETAVKASKIAKNIKKSIKTVLAGGMSTERIKGYEKILDKYFDYVDVNSGVEDAPGIKNPLKIKELFGIKGHLSIKY